MKENNADQIEQLLSDNNLDFNSPPERVTGFLRSKGFSPEAINKAFTDRGLPAPSENENKENNSETINANLPPEHHNNSDSMSQMSEKFVDNLLDTPIFGDVMRNIINVDDPSEESMKNAKSIFEELFDNIDNKQDENGKTLGQRVGDTMEQNLNDLKKDPSRNNVAERKKAISSSIERHVEPEQLKGAFALLAELGKKMKDNAQIGQEVREGLKGVQLRDADPSKGFPAPTAGGRASNQTELG